MRRARKSRDDLPILDSDTYTPVRLLNEAAFALQANSMYQLARVLEMDNGQLSRVRNRKEAVSDRLMVQIMDRTGWHIQKLREIAGMPYDGMRSLVVISQAPPRKFPTNLIDKPAAKRGVPRV
jgi:hypothetical protein